MSKKVLTIETGSWWTKVCLVEPTKKSPRVHDAFYIRTPEDAIEDGYIRDKESLALIIREELLKRQIKERTVTFSVNSSKVITREVVMPKVKDNQLDGIVKLQAQEHFPMDISSHTISYIKMDEFEDESGKMLKLLLVAVPDNLLSSYCAFAELAGFTIDTFDYAGNAAIQFLNTYSNEDKVIVQLCEQSTVISVISDGKLVFERVSPYGFYNTLEVILDHPVFNVNDLSEAYNLMVTHDLLFNKPKSAKFYDSKVIDLDERQGLLDEAYADLKESFAYQMRVVYTALDYYKNQTNEEFKGSLHLIGDGAQFAGIDSLFEVEVPLEIRRRDWINEIRFVSYDSERGERLGGGFGLLSVIGAVINPLNILPKEMMDRESSKNALHNAYIALSVVAVLSIALVLAGVVRHQMALKEQKIIQDELARLEYIEAVYDEYEAVKKEAGQYEAFDNMTKTQNERMGDLISDLENWFPTPVTVQNLTITEDSISMNVTCDVKMTAAQLLMNLQEIPYLANASIPSMTETEDANGNTIWQFTVNVNYVDPVEESAQ